MSYRVPGMINKFAADEQGGANIEYGLLALIIGVSIIGLLRSISGELINIFTLLSAGF